MQIVTCFAEIGKLARCGLAVPLVFLLCCDSKPPGTKENQEQKNVLLIVADDLGTQLGAYGDARALTPRLDELARRGVAFERAYCQFPLCNPSRVSFLTGLEPRKTRVFDNATPPRHTLTDATFLPDRFRQSGYFLFRAGKILHATFEDTVAWDEVADLRPLLGKTTRPPSSSAEKNVEANDGKVDQLAWWLADEKQELLLNDHRVADRAIAAIARVGARQPFLMALGFSSSHAPYIPPRRLFDRIPAAGMTPPPSPPDDLADLPDRALRQAARRPTLTVQEKTDLRRAYYASVAFLDEQVGRVLDALDRAGLAPSTLVVFVGDNGVHLGEHGELWEKMTLFEETLHVPWLLAGPGVARGARHPCVAELTDLYPTVLGLAGVRTPRGLDGRDLRPALADPGRCGDRTALSVLRLGLDDHQLAFSLRSARYRYTDWGNRHAIELYDHESDPGEHHNLAEATGDAAAMQAKNKHRRLLVKRLAPPAS